MGRETVSRIGHFPVIEELGAAPAQPAGEMSAVLADPPSTETRPPEHIPAPPAVDGATPVSPAPSTDERRAWRLRFDVEQVAWALVVLFAALVRLPALGALPLGLDDCVRALAAWQIAAGRLPAAWAGDLSQTMTALLFKLFASGDGMARLVPALLGVGLVAVFWFYRPLLGRVPALIAALAIALSPVCVAVSRSLSPYAAGVLFAVATGAALLSFLESPRPAPFAWLAGLVGLGLSTDASFLLFLFVAMLFCLVEGLWWRRPEFERAARLLRTDGPLLRSSALIGLAGLLVSTTRFGVGTERLRSAAALSWTQAFTASTGAAPWHFSFDALLAYELPLFLGGIVASVALFARARRGRATLPERFLLYWTLAAFVFVMVVSRKEMGQLPALLAPLALVVGVQCSCWFATARWTLLRAAVIPVLLALPALVYVLFVLQSTTIAGNLSLGQEMSLGLLFIGGAGLLVLGAVWSREAAPAYLAICGLTLGGVFALHTLARVGFQPGDEFLLGSVATANAPALAQEIGRVAPSLNGPVSIDPQLATPMGWYARDDAAARVQTLAGASAGAVLPAERASPAGFQRLVQSSEIARTWYPAGVDLEGILRWLLYRQAWEPVHGSSAQFVIKGG